jgi:hypothetical protein
MGANPAGLGGRIHSGGHGLGQASGARQGQGRYQQQGKPREYRIMESGNPKPLTSSGNKNGHDRVHTAYRVKI